MMNAMRSDPEDRSTFERHRAASGQKVLQPTRHSVAAMRQQPVVSHTDAHVDREEVHNSSDNQVLPREEEQRRDRADMEHPHEDAGDPVDAAFLIRATHAQVLLQSAAGLADRGESFRFAGDGREFEERGVCVRESLIALCCGVDQCCSPSK
jgi:hypothetical protein